MATRAAQKTEIVTAAQALAFVAHHGIACESAASAKYPSLAAAIVGTPIRGNWWSHPRGKEIFALTRAVRDAADVLTCRMVDAKITFVHERLWPALVRAKDHLPRKHLARLREVHRPSGKHEIEETPFPDWVPRKAIAAAKRLSEAQALALLGIEI